MLPAAVAAAFLDEVKEDIAAAIMLSDGRTYYGEPAISAGQLADARKDLNPSAANFGTYLQDKEPVALFANESKGDLSHIITVDDLGRKGNGK